MKFWYIQDDNIDLLVIFTKLAHQNVQMYYLQLACGGKHDKSFIANILLKPMVKEFWKSANICQSFEPIISLVFFWLTV